jgi:glycosyltransferase involved in cell wall biosynthesis
MEKEVKSPRVSICIPTYCQTQYLEETLISIREQDFHDYEIIVSDDSPDDMVEKLVASFNFGEKLKYYHNITPFGAPGNWNRAVSLATGDLVKLMHHDDKFENSSALGSFVRLLDESPGANLAFGATLVHHVNDNKKIIHRSNRKNYLKLSASPVELFFGNLIGAPSAVIYRRGIDIEYDERMKWLVDVDFYIRFLKKYVNVAYTSDVLIVTTSGANHQVTRSCENNFEVEFFEYLLLYEKNINELQRDSRTKKLWFRLFEKYQIFSLIDVMQRNAKNEIVQSTVLDGFFEDYKREWPWRLAYRTYLSLPVVVRNGVICLRRFGKTWRS